MLFSLILVRSGNYGGGGVGPPWVSQLLAPMVFQPGALKVKLMLMFTSNSLQVFNTGNGGFLSSVSNGKGWLSVGYSETR